MSNHSGHEVHYRRFFDPARPFRTVIELFCLTCGVLERKETDR